MRRLHLMDDDDDDVDSLIWCDSWLMDLDDRFRYTSFWRRHALGAVSEAEEKQRQAMRRPAGILGAIPTLPEKSCDTISHAVPCVHGDSMFTDLQRSASSSESHALLHTRTMATIYKISSATSASSPSSSPIIIIVFFALHAGLPRSQRLGQTTRQTRWFSALGRGSATATVQATHADGAVSRGRRKTRVAGTGPFDGRLRWCGLGFDGWSRRAV